VRSSLEIGSHDIEKLRGGLGIESAGMSFGIDEVGEHVILDHFRRQSGQRSADAREKMHDLLATSLALKGMFDGFDLASDTANARQQLLFFANGVCHGGYIE
jgi:hypothetical protein